MRQELIIKELEETKPIKQKKIQKMSKIYCPCCNSNKNTFVIDSCGFFVIRLCIDCALKEGYFKNIELIKASTCVSCGQKFMARGDWQKNCPICYIENVKGGFSNGKNS